MDPWQQGMAGALAARAAEMAEAGDEEAARRTAEEALELAQTLGEGRSMGRALAVLGWLDRDLEQLTAARELALKHAPPMEQWDLRLLLADVMLDSGQVDEAIRELDPVIDQAAAWPDVAVRARAEAPARRMRSVARRRKGQIDAARDDDRQALLLLTVLPDFELRELRLALGLARGDDLFALGDPSDAYALHTRARTLAAALGDVASESRALAAQAADLAALGRQGDAADRALLAVDYARAAGDDDLARRVALDALGWLEERGEAVDSLRRLRLLKVLRELDGSS